MWVVVVFVAGDVSAVPFSWILRIDGKIWCFWPLDKPRDKIMKNFKPPESPNEYWELYECRILFNDTTFKSYKMALQNERYGQKHSNLESQEESDEIRAESRKHPRTKFSCDSDEDIPDPAKRPKCVSKCGKKPTKRSVKIPKQSAERMSSSDESDDNKYIFVKNSSNSTQNVMHNATDAQLLEKNETPKSFVGAALEGVCEINGKATASDQHIDVILENLDENQADEMPMSTPNVFKSQQIDVIFENTDGNQTNETVMSKPDVVTSTEQHVDVIFENNDEIQNNDNTENTYGVHQGPEPVQLNSVGTDNILLETIDFSDNVLGKIHQKLSEVLQNQNDFKKVLVDITYRLMKLEQRIKKLNSTPTNAIVQQLGLPIKDKNKFAEIEVALEDVDNYEQLQKLASSYQAPSVNEFVKKFLKEMLNLDFLYDHVVWRGDASKVLIKDTKLARCMFDAIKVKFPEIREKQMEDDAILATRQVKDCYRKKKPIKPII